MTWRSNLTRYVVAFVVHVARTSLSLSTKQSATSTCYCMVNWTTMAPPAPNKYSKVTVRLLRKDTKR